MNRRGWWRLVVVTSALASGLGCRTTARTGVARAWEAVAREGVPFTWLAPTGDGAVLAATQTDVFRVDAAGQAVRVYAGTLGPPRTRPVLNATGETFGILQRGGFALFDAGGERLTELPIAPLEYVKLIPGSRRVFLPKVQVLGIDEGVVTAVRIVNEHGTVDASFPTPGLRISRLTERHLVYATRSELVKTTLAGEGLWRIPAQVQSFELSTDAQRIIATASADARIVLHLREAAEVGRTSLDGAVWNLAFSPSGTYSVATTQRTAYVFREGALRRSIRLRIASANSVAISDSGEVLVGGQDGRHRSHVLLYDTAGRRLWTTELETDTQGWRPEVRFLVDGDRFLVRGKRGVTSYRIERRP
jgi:hypothetical protein